MKVLVTMAVENEFAPWRRLRAFRRIVGTSYANYEAEIGATAVRVVLTGMGAEVARRAAAEALASAPDMCISSGLAGALKPEYHVGDVLAARQVSSGEAQGALAADEELLAVAADCRARVVERFVTSARLIVGSAEKREMGRLADAVEMESYAVLGEAVRRGVRSIAIRAISDSCDTDLPFDFDRARDARGQIHLPAVVAMIARRPRGLPALVHLARDCSRAARSLAQFLDLYVGSVAAQGTGTELEEVSAT